MFFNNIFNNEYFIYKEMLKKKEKRNNKIIKIIHSM